MSYLGKIDVAGKIRESMPVCWRSPNQIDLVGRFQRQIRNVAPGDERRQIAAAGPDHIQTTRQFVKV